MERRALLAYGALVALVLAVYANALAVPFLWDDRALVLDEATVHDGQAVLRYFTRSFWPEAGVPQAYFRPLVALSYRADFLLHGENPAGYHVTNVAFHLVNVCLLFALAKRWGASIVASALAAGAWALLPRLTEDVTWISGRTDVLALTGVLGAFLLWPRPADGRRWASVVAASFALLCGLFCKEVALAGLAGLVVYQLTMPRERSLRARLLELLPLAVVAGVYMALRANALGPEPMRDGLSSGGARVAAALASWGTYAGMLVVPWRPLLQIGLVGEGAPIAMAGGLGALAAIAWVLVRSVRRRDGAIAAGATTLGVALLLVSHLVAIPTTGLAADRFLYVPAAAIAWAAAIAVGHAPPSARRVAGWLGTGWVLASAFATFTRNVLMSDEAMLWLDTAEHAGSAKALPLAELGNVLFRAGLCEEALKVEDALTRAERRDSQSGVLEHVWASQQAALSCLGDYERARRIAESLVEAYPASGKHWLDLARVELHALRFQDGRVALQRARSATDTSAEVADLSRTLDELEPAAAACEQTRSGLGAGDTASVLRLARFEVRAGRRREAEIAWSEFLGRSDAAPAALEEGAAFLVLRGTLQAATTAVGRISHEPTLGSDAALMSEALNDRRVIADRAALLLPRVEKLHAPSEE